MEVAYGMVFVRSTIELRRDVANKRRAVFRVYGNRLFHSYPVQYEQVSVMVGLCGGQVFTNVIGSSYCVAMFISVKHIDIYIWVILFDVCFDGTRVYEVVVFAE